MTSSVTRFQRFWPLRIWVTSASTSTLALDCVAASTRFGVWPLPSRRPDPDLALSTVSIGMSIRPASAFAVYEERVLAGFHHTEALLEDLPVEHHPTVRGTEVLDRTVRDRSLGDPGHHVLLKRHPRRESLRSLRP